MNAKEFLAQYSKKTYQIEALQDKIAEMRACAEKCTSVLSPTPGGNAHNDSRLEELVIKINTMEERLGILWEERGGIYIEIVNLLCEIPTDICRQILEMRYLEMNTFNQIAEKLLLSVPYVYQLHKAALKEAETIRSEKHKQS